VRWASKIPAGNPRNIVEPKYKLMKTTKRTAGITISKLTWSFRQPTVVFVSKHLTGYWGLVLVLLSVSKLIALSQAFLIQNVCVFEQFNEIQNNGYYHTDELPF